VRIFLGTDPRLSTLADMTIFHVSHSALVSLVSRVATAAVFGIGAVACGGGEPQPSAPGSGAPATFAEQVAQGQQLFGDKCASCHGAHGNDGKAPKLVGLKEGALSLDPPASAKARKQQFKTVADVADFVTKNMPPGAGGSLTADQYWSILAFDLKANGIDLGDKKLDPTLASTLTIPR
jgi:mono/diheme cytochrome c family protein